MPINQRQTLHTKNSVILFLAHTVVTISVDIQLHLRWTTAIPRYEGNVSDAIGSQSVKADSCILLICDEIIALRSDGSTCDCSLNVRGIAS